MTTTEQLVLGVSTGTIGIRWPMQLGCRDWRLGRKDRTGNRSRRRGYTVHRR